MSRRQWNVRPVGTWGIEPSGTRLVKKVKKGTKKEQVWRGKIRSGWD